MEEEYIKAYVRIRPSTSSTSLPALKRVDYNKISNVQNDDKHEHFEFTKVFEEERNIDLFNEVVQPNWRCLLKGINRKDSP